MIKRERFSDKHQRSNKYCALCNKYYECQNEGGGKVRQWKWCRCQLHHMCLFSGRFHPTVQSQSDLVTLWLTGEWYQRQAAPIPPGPNVAQSEWIGEVGEKIAFEPKKNNSPFFYSCFLLPLARSVCAILLSFSPLSLCCVLLPFWALWLMMTWERVKVWIKLQ